MSRAVIERLTIQALGYRSILSRGAAGGQVRRASLEERRDGEYWPFDLVDLQLRDENDTLFGRPGIFLPDINPN